MKTKALDTRVTDIEQRMEKVESKVSGKVHKEIHEAINERTDIDRRKLNLVVYNLPEASVTIEDSAWDSNERVQNDMEQICVTLQNEMEIDLKTKIINARRLGKKKKGESDKYTARPLKITFSDLQSKRDVLTKSTDLRKSDNPVAKNLYINPDLTPAQRENDRKLREKMWELREKDKKNVIIQKGEIIEVTWDVPKFRQKRFDDKHKQDKVQDKTTKNATPVDKQTENDKDAVSNNPTNNAKTVEGVRNSS